MSELARGEFPDGHVVPSALLKPLTRAVHTHERLDVASYWPKEPPLDPTLVIPPGCDTDLAECLFDAGDEVPAGRHADRCVHGRAGAAGRGVDVP